MKFDRNKKYATIALYACGVAAFSIIFLCVMLNLRTVWSMLEKLLVILNPIIYGFVIAFVINPLVKIFEKHVFGRIPDGSVTGENGEVTAIKSRRKLRRILAMLVSYIIVFVLIALFITLLIPQVAQSYRELDVRMTGYISGAQKWAESLIDSAQKGKGLSSWIIGHVDMNKLSANVMNAITDSYDLVQEISPHIVKFISSILDSVKNSLVGIIISIYFLYSKERLCAQMRKTLFAFCNDRHSNRILRVTRKTGVSFEKFISGKLLDSIIIGLLTFVVLMIFKMPFYPLIAVIVGVTNIIPFFGPFIGAIPSAFIIFVVDPLKCFWFIVIIIIIQQLDGNVIGPSILGGQTGLSALWVVISIIVMGGILGITGMFIGVPVVAVLYSLFSEILGNKLKSKGRAVYTESYIDAMNVDSIMSYEEEKATYGKGVPEKHHVSIFVKFNEWLKKTVKNLFAKLKSGKGKK